MKTNELLNLARRDEEIALKKVAQAKTLQAFISANAETIEELYNPSIFDGKIDFNYPPRNEVVRILKAFPGKWSKALSGNDRITYTLEGEITLRIYAGEPPPSCRIITEEIEVPQEIVPAKLVPAHKKTVRRLECVPVIESQMPEDQAEFIP